MKRVNKTIGINYENLIKEKQTILNRKYRKNLVCNIINAKYKFV